MIFLIRGYNKKYFRDGFLFFGFFDDFQIDSESIAAGDRHKKSADRIDRLALLADDFTDVGFFDGEFDDEGMSAGDLIDAYLIRMISQVFDDVVNKYFHSRYRSSIGSFEAK